MFAISSHSLAILRNSFLSIGEEVFAADRRALAASPRKRFIRCSGVSESPDTAQASRLRLHVNNGIAGAWVHGGLELFPAPAVPDQPQKKPRKRRFRGFFCFMR